jgi:hypothetical protein
LTPALGSSEDNGNKSKAEGSKRFRALSKTFSFLFFVARDSGIVLNGWRIERHKGAIANSAEIEE